MNDVKLSEMNSPTREQPGPHIKPDVFTFDAQDDSGEGFRVLCTYHSFTHNGSQHMVEYNYRIVWPVGFVPIMRPGALHDDVRQAIEAREGGRITWADSINRAIDDIP